MENYGKVAQVKIVIKNECAFVEFEERKDAELAYDKLHKTCMINLVPLKVLWAWKEPEIKVEAPKVGVKWTHKEAFETKEIDPFDDDFELQCLKK